jgi:hypothetical protein
MHLSFQDSMGINLNVNNNTLFRTTTDTGSYRHLATEALVDSIKLIINLLDGPYHGDAVWSDSVPLKIYNYSKVKPEVKQGLILIGLREGSGVKYYETDTSSVVLTNWDLRKQTMSGSFYFEANGHTVKGAGTFNNVCFVSLK